MALLAYCIAVAGRKIEAPKRGVQQCAIRAITDSGLVAFTSEYAASQNREQVRTTALEFNYVLQHLFRQVAIIPFRFPTVLADESEVSAFLRDHADEYHGILTRLRDSVQMEIHLSSNAPPPSAESGTEYLRSRQARSQQLAEMTEEVRQRLAPSIQDWRQHEGSTVLRCYILVARSAVPGLLEQLQGTHVPPGLNARVTGPWPATEFLAENASHRRNITGLKNG